MDVRGDFLGPPHGNQIKNSTHMLGVNRNFITNISKCYDAHYGHDCSKLMTSLTYDWLKFQT